MQTLMGAEKNRNLLANPNVSLWWTRGRITRARSAPAMALTMNGRFRSPDSPNRRPTFAAAS